MDIAAGKPPRIVCVKKLQMFGKALKIKNFGKNFKRHLTSVTKYIQQHIKKLWIFITMTSITKVDYN